MISFRLTAHPTKSHGRYIVAGVERDSGFTRSSNGLTLKWVYYEYGRTKANNWVFELALTGLKTSHESISGLQISLILTDPGKLTIDPTKKTSGAETS